MRKKYCIVENFALFSVTARLTRQTNCLSTPTLGCSPWESATCTIQIADKLETQRRGVGISAVPQRKVSQRSNLHALPIQLQRHQNNKNNMYFFQPNNCLGKNSPTPQDLKKKIRQGHFKFINMLRYYARYTSGSDNS